MRRVIKFIRAGRREQGLLLGAWSALVAIKLALKILPFHVVYRLHQRWTCSPARRPAAGLASPAEVVRATERVSYYVPGGRNCLARALTGKLLLARRGHDALLRLGAARMDDKIQAHAWLEYEGKILIGQEAAGQFTPFPPGRIQ